MIALHPFQHDVVAKYESHITEGIGAEIIKRAHLKYVLFIAHRGELLTQARDKLARFEVAAGIIKAGRDRDLRPLAFVQVAGIQTLHARAIRAKSMALPPADIVFVDEAHHVRARTYQTIIEAYPNAIIIGLTATPCRCWTWRHTRFGLRRIWVCG